MAITVTPTWGAGNVSIKPIEYGSYGHFRAIAQTGATVSLTAGDPILSFRWTSTSSNAVLLRLSVTSNITSNITTTVNFDLQASKVTGFTAADSGGTAVSLGSTGKKRTSMGNSGIGDFRVATTGKLTAGTRTLDTNGFAFINVPMAPTVTNVGAASVPMDLYKYEVLGEHPLLFTANEGFIVTVPVAANTSGAVRHTFTVDWAEVALPPATTTPAY